MEEEVVKELERMHKACHEAIRQGNLEHLPMCYVKYEEEIDTEKLMKHLEEEKPLGDMIKTFYICRKCISDWIIRTKAKYMDRVMILRGEITEEAKRVYYNWLREGRK